MSVEQKQLARDLEQAACLLDGVGAHDAAKVVRAAAIDHLDTSIAAHLFIEQRGDGIWLVCVEKVHKTMRDAQAACTKWIELCSNPAPSTLPDEPEIIGTMRKNLDGWDNRVVISYIDALRAHLGRKW